MAFSPLIVLFAVLFGTVALVLVIVHVVVPLLRGVGWMIMGFFRGFGWLIKHLAEYVGGTIGDVFRFVSTIPVIFVLAPIMLATVALGRWSAAAHFARSIRREVAVAGTCLYGMALRRPLKLVWMHGLLEGVEQRVPEAFAAAPGKDKPGRRHQFDGYTITGSLPSGGSGAKLYIATPSADVKRRTPDIPDEIVIKSFALEEGSALPQIVRESRALESAKRLGAVYEHGMDDGRFWYVMPYHEGDHLGLVTRQLHAESGGPGLDGRRLRKALDHVSDLATQLDSYHAEGLWHKDVKPENVIVTAEGARLVDLGLVTPLHSAMTLTTHGTEYFRDPELVRQALRGVKVHQVDGAKFDVFGIGAVLYFVIENDFPAHGPLSRFARRSPDAVKWIVRRAMADYAHRYTSASALLADLRVVATAKDPFAVRPADLPSMGGTMADAEAEELFAVQAEAAAAAAAAPGAAAKPSAPGAPAPPRAPETVAAERPKLRREGFLGFAYHVIDPGAKSGGAQGDGSPSNVDRVLEDIGRTVERVSAEASAAARRAKGRSGRKAAEMKERRAARRDARKVASGVPSKHTPRRVGPWRPLADGLTVAVMLAVGFLIVAAVVRSLDEGGSESRAEARADRASERPAVAVIGGDVDDAAFELVSERRRGEGYDVVRLPAEAGDRLGDLLRLWESSDRADFADVALEDMLEAWGLYGVVEVTTRGEAVSDRLVHSTRDGARDRSTVAGLFAQPVPSGPLLLVVDHPRAARRDIAERIDAVVSQLADIGWPIDRTPEIEADLRTVLPIRTDTRDVPMTPVLEDKLRGHELAGILRVIADPEDETGVVVQILRPDTMRATSIPVPDGFIAPRTPLVPAMPSIPGESQGSVLRHGGGVLAFAGTGRPGFESLQGSVGNRRARIDPVALAGLADEFEGAGRELGDLLRTAKNDLVREVTSACRDAVHDATNCSQ